MICLISSGDRNWVINTSTPLPPAVIGVSTSISVISRDLSISNPDLLLDTKIQFYNYDLLTQNTSVALPKFTAGINTYISHGRHVFYNSVGTRYFSIVEAEESSGLLNRFGIVIH